MGSFVRGPIISTSLSPLLQSTRDPVGESGGLLGMPCGTTVAGPVAGGTGGVPIWKAR